MEVHEKMMHPNPTENKVNNENKVIQLFFCCQMNFLMINNSAKVIFYISSAQQEVAQKGTQNIQRHKQKANQNKKTNKK